MLWQIGLSKVMSARVIGVVEIFVGLLLAVAVLALLARKLHIPYPIFFVIGGLVLGLIPGLPQVRLGPELAYFILSATPSVSGGTVHLVARFSGKPAPHRTVGDRPGSVYHGRRCLSRTLFHGASASSPLKKSVE
jgi:hypothetical protein